MFDWLVASLSKVVDKLPLADVIRTRSVASREHDQAKFRELDQILSEKALDQFLEEAYQLQIQQETFHPIDEYIEWSRLSSNDFLLRKVHRARIAFTTTLRQLRGFLSVNIFHEKGDDRFLYFRPDQDPSRAITTPEQREFFEERQAELHRRIDACEEAYRSLRALVKRLLYV